MYPDLSRRAFGGVIHIKVIGPIRIADLLGGLWPRLSRLGCEVKLTFLARAAKGTCEQLHLTFP